MLDEEDEVAVITRQVRKFLQKKKRSQENFKEFKKNFTSKGESNKGNGIICYKCRKLGHMRGEYPKLQKKLKKEKPHKCKAMIAT